MRKLILPPVSAEMIPLRPKLKQDIEFLMTRKFDDNWRDSFPFYADLLLPESATTGHNEADHDYEDDICDYLEVEPGAFI